MTSREQPVTEKNDVLNLDDATPEQIERANEAVQHNLNDDGSPKFDSAQGYACALTAIMLSARPTASADAMEICDACNGAGDDGHGHICRKCGGAGGNSTATADVVERVATVIEREFYSFVDDPPLPGAKPFEQIARAALSAIGGEGDNEAQ